METQTDYGVVKIEKTGNTITFADLFYYNPFPEPNSDGSPHFEEGGYWGLNDFYLIHKSEQYSLKTKNFGPSYNIPRHSEVIGGNAYILYGEFNYPNSERFEAFVDRALSGGNDLKEDFGLWKIVEIEKKERGDIVNYVKSPSGDTNWTYNELSESDLANNIISGNETDINFNTGDTSNSNPRPGTEAPRAAQDRP